MNRHQPIIRTAMRTAGLWMVDGHILLEAMTGTERWGIPGGRLQPGATAEAGCLREFQEELGLEMQSDGLALINENFWHDPSGPIREYCFYFRVRPKQTDQRARGDLASREPQLQFRWFPLEALADLDFVPRPLRTVIPNLSQATLFLTTRE
jgi:ADP-ribose pyrophosphatase YjhB (NUDIX family)